MDKKIIHVSDIHYDNFISETNGIVINSFFEDISKECNDIDNTYCVISGDLVNRGTKREYDIFYDNFIKKLTEYVHLKNIICIPGNHDLDRSIVENRFSEHETIANSEDEEKFNSLIKQEEDNIIQKKFDSYTNFCKEKLFKLNCNHYGFSEQLVPEISIFCLNSALLSVGGYNNIEDSKKLKIETSELNKWIQNNAGRTKILLLHHPIDYLTDYYQAEIKSMLRNNDINIVISGHVHDQDICSRNNNNQVICSSPQLFSKKQDLNGYAIYNFNKGNLLQIKYRQWVHRQRKFMVGQDFSGTDNGTIDFKCVLQNNDADIISILLKSEFDEVMKSYSVIPIWSERYLTTLAPNNISKEKEKQLDYLNIINQPNNYQIIAAPQFGLTCYARYLAMKSWEVKRNLWLYVDCSNIKLSTIENELNSLVSKYNSNIDSIKCLLLDNWNNKIKDSQKILQKIKRILEIPLIIFSHYNDKIILNGIDTEESHDGFKPLYLKELDKKSIRTIVKEFNNKDYIAEDSVLLNRICMDITDLNIHRTPLNCLQLLLSFKQNFTERPINRSKVFSYILQLIFNNTSKLFYGNTLDEDDCKFILGGFCEYLLKNNLDFFSEKEFLDTTTEFAKTNYNTTNLPDLLQTLKNNQIIVVDYQNNLRFRFTCWIYYFAAERMKLIKSFFDYMFKEKYSMYVPDIIEFYTGTDSAREDAIEILIKELQQLSEIVHNKLGVINDINPFENIKWRLNEIQDGGTQKQLEDNIRKSKLPEEIKDSMDDTNYDSIKPYNQAIYNYFEQYELKNLMDLTRSTSRALRNSLLIAPDKKEALSNEIFKAWKEIFRGLFLIAPILAKTGFGGVGGANFKLTDDFPKEYAECLKCILINMPYNVVIWYKDDIFSDKIFSLFNKFMIECPDPIVRHTIALLICHCRPIDWDKSIIKYIESVHKNSYYLGDIYTNLRNCYAIQDMSHKELNQTETLIKVCWSKHNTGSKAVGKDSIAKVPNNVLPNRDMTIMDN